MIRKILILSCAAASTLLLSSCFVENQIVPDPEVDSRLIGVWEAVWRSDDEIPDPKSPRYIDYIGVRMLIVGEAEPDEVTVVGIDGFGPDGIQLSGHFAGRTRSADDKDFLLLENTKIPGYRSDQERDENFQFVSEYEFNEQGDLFLWISGDIKEMTAEHPIDHEIVEANDAFGGYPLITGTSDELLEFYTNPEVSKLMRGAGKYRKLKLPEGNSPPITEESPR